MNLLTNSECSSILEKCGLLESKILDVKFIRLNEEQTGFLGDYFNMEILTNDRDGLHKFFIKLLPTDVKTLEKYVEELGVFKKELDLYSNLLGKLQKFSTVPWSPKCYLIKENLMVMEDLYNKGFEAVNARVYFDFEQVEAFVTTLARYHSTSVIYEENIKYNTKSEFKIVDSFGKLLTESAYVSDNTHIRKRCLKCNSDAVMSALKLLPTFKAEYEDKWSFMLEKLPDLVKPSTKYRNVVCHGDLWANNMMFRRNNGKLECILFDFQFARYCSPVYDFMIGMHTTTSALFRKKYLNKYTNIYYETMKKELEQFNIDIEVVFSKHEFLDACKYYRPLGLIDATLNSMLIFFKSEDIKSIMTDSEQFVEFTLNSKSEFVSNCMRDDFTLKSRIHNILNDLIKTVLSQDLTLYFKK